MKREKQISFETAKLAKKKGIKIESNFNCFYDEKSKTPEKLIYAFFDDDLEDLNEFQYPSCTLSELQNHIIAEYEEVPWVAPTYVGGEGYKFKSRYNGIQASYTYFDTFEEALEDAIIYALNTIES